MKYKVGIPKNHFPRDKWERFSDCYEVVVVDASSREEAAIKTWQQHGGRWEALFAPKQTSRLMPIKVAEE